jgi:hypothetical protein
VSDFNCGHSATHTHTQRLQLSLQSAPTEDIAAAKHKQAGSKSTRHGGGYKRVHGAGVRGLPEEGEGGGWGYSMEAAAKGLALGLAGGAL